MSIEGPTDDRVELYNAFRKALEEGDEDTFFDADELVAIIDLAVDYKDDYVRLSALMRAYRYFPDNEELKARRGFMFLDFEINEGAAATAARPVGSSPLWTLLKLRAEREKTTPEQAREALDALVAKTRSLDDESAIQLVDCASDYGLFDWLLENQSTLRKKTDYLPALLYELSGAANAAGQLSVEILLLEELTQIDPFTVENWQSLTNALASSRRLDEALSAVDYALALDSDDPEMITMKGYLLIELERPAEAVELLAPLVSDELLDKETQIIYYYCLALIQSDRIEKAVEILKERASRRPDDTASFDLLLSVATNEGLRRLMPHYKAVGQTDIDAWIQRAEAFFDREVYAAAAEMLIILFSDKKLPHGAYATLFSALYMAKYYENCVDNFEFLLAKRPEMLTPDICIAGLLAMVRLGERERALHAIARIPIPMKVYPRKHISGMLSMLGFGTFLSALRAHLESPEAFDLEQFDIFTP